MKTLELYSDLGESLLDLVSVFLGLVQVRAPSILILQILVDLEFVCHTFDFNLPLFGGDSGVDDCVGSHICLHLLGHIVLDAASDTEIHVFVDLPVRDVSVHLVSHVCTTIEIITVHLVSLII